MTEIPELPEKDPSSGSGEGSMRVQCPNCCRLARVTGRSMGLLLYQCELCLTVGAAPDPDDQAPDL